MKYARPHLAFFLLVSPLLAAPVSHVRFLPDPEEDLRLGATTPSGVLPAALHTRSGTVSAPSEAQTSGRFSDGAYGGTRTPTSADASYYVDRLTTRPERVQYDEPFRPSILPFKRLYAFDALRDDLSFAVGSKALSQVSVGGVAKEQEDVFFGDFEVDLVKGVPVRVPSVGPGARLLAMHVDPPRPVQILEDGAENWFAQSDTGGRVRIVMQLSVARQSFGSLYLPVSWSALAPYVPTISRAAAAAAAEVARHIGVRRTDPPARALMTMVRYFRKFQESSDLPQASGAVELYRELSFEQKGVCRHRAYAFAVTAIALGMPTRLVHNEAHAWVEVYDTKLWHRIDLGGAASNIQETRADPTTPHHKPPSDPYSWPSESQAAQLQQQGIDSRAQSVQQALLKSRSVTDRSGADGSAATTAGQASGSGAEASSSSAVVGAADSLSAGRFALGGGDQRKALDAGVSTKGREVEVKLSIDNKRLLRGRPLPLSGTVEQEGRRCAFARIDIYLTIPEPLSATEQGGSQAISIGSIATDQKGEFRGQVTLPQSTPVGPLRVSARASGGCK